ncbi:hypothetical protein NDU88_006990 [Pleurodeles waltl]|uniref:Uncharacterized protein n=1 Tax=Pleurodeles waltl TaxID=8319 RepID=A0AAV7RN34_PLEWA|nr:hypothetical protein NDU88_006990 [Pleurodeles waltl]
MASAGGVTDWPHGPTEGSGADGWWKRSRGDSPGVGLALGDLLPPGRALRRSTRRLREAADFLWGKLAWARMVNF